MKNPLAFRMIRSLLTTLLLGMFTALPSYAQTARIDSLQRALNRAKHDSVRVRAHADLCYFLAIRDNERARAHGREALALARRLGTSTAKAVAHTSVGYFQVQTWETKEGRKNLETGLKYAIAARDGAMAVRALRGLGMAEKYRAEPDSAVMYYQRALDAASGRGDSSMMGTVLGEIGYLHHAAGRHERALQCYLRSQSLFDRHGPRAAASDQWVNTGKLFHDMRKLGDAMEHYNRGLRVAEELRDTSKVSQHLHGIGVKFLRRDDVDQAMKYFRRCLELRERIQDESGIGEVLGNIGNVYYNRGDIDSALISYKRGLAIWEQLREIRHSAAPLANIARILRERGDTDKALEIFERCRAIYEEVGDRSNLELILGNIATVQSDRGNHKEALKEYRRVLHLMEASGNRDGIPQILSNIALTLYRLGRYVDALDYAQRTLELAEKLGNKNVQLDALQSLADIHNLQKRYDLSLEYERRGLRLSEESNNKKRGAEFLMGMGSLYYYQGKDEAALDHYSRALAIFESLQIPIRIADALRRMARLHDRNERLDEALHCYRRCLSISQANGPFQSRTLADMSVLFVKRGSLDSAIILASQALAISRERGDRADEEAAARSLGIYHMRKGNYAKAYEFLRSSTELRDSLVNTENLRTINEMEAKYSTAEKQRQIAELEAEKQGQLLAITRKEKQLVVQRLEAERNRQHAELLAQENKLQILELDKRTTELELRTRDLVLQKKEKERVTREKNLQASVATQATSLRNALLAGMVLFLAVGFLGVKRIQSRRREALLRAEAAEYELQAAEAKRLALEVQHERRARQTQRRYTKQLIDTQERERKRIAGELHDSLGQELLVIKNRTLYALQNNTLSQQAREEFEQIERMATAALKNVRHISHDLRPYQLDRVGLTKTLRSTIQQLSDQSMLHCDCDIDDIDHLLSKEDETNIYRIVQESLNNVLKHSGATAVAVRITRHPSFISLVVSDNGRGIDGDAETSPEAGFGLQNMRERARMLGGTLRLDAAPGGGVQVNIELPVPLDRATAAA